MAVCGKKKLELVGYASGLGAKLRSTAQGPNTLKAYLEGDSSLLTCFLPWNRLVFPKKSLHFPDLPALSEVAYVNRQLYVQLAHILEQGNQPWVIGGDHTSAIATWSQLIDFYDDHQHFGLIWIDAHMDAHTFETTPSQAVHGMPLACLLGQGDPALDLGKARQKLDPKQVVLIGVRSFEPEEAKLLNQLNVKIFYQHDVEEQGFAKVWQQAIDRVTENTKGFGLSIDLDAFDPEEAPGVGSPAVNGLWAHEVLPVLKGIAHHPRLRAVEIAEFNPELDKEQRTLKLVIDLIQSMTD